MKGTSRQFSLNIHSSLDFKKRETDFNDIWKEYYPKLTVYLKTIYPGVDTEDIVQEILLKVFRTLHRYNPYYSFNTWIYSIARNSALDSLRKSSVSLKVLTSVRSEARQKLMYDNETPEELFIKGEVKTGIAECIENLPETERQISFLKFYEGLTYKEISNILGVPVGTLKYLVHNIKKKVEAHYYKQYGEVYGSR